MQKRTVITILCGTSVLLGVGLIAAEKRQVTRAFMRQKLAYSQGILEGLTLGKFDLVSKNALRMRSMSVSNTFLVIHYKEYLEHITNYQGNIDALITSAADKDLHRATEAYAKVATSCVDCHQYFRSEQRSKDGKSESVK